MEYRNDLTGLRAIAVTAVMLFHFGVVGFGGGFAGVDVFFVISGYLMTSIIAGGLTAGNFSFATFYRSRAKRIVPALAVLCLALLVFGLFYMGKREFYILSKHAVSSMFFGSNFTYRNEAGYFDADSHEKWLLHTWSLSVEWQFYLLYPLVLAAVACFRRPDSRAFRTTLWLLAAASFATSVWLIDARPGDAFFLLPARVWELLAGGLVYVYAIRLGKLKAGRLLELSGLSLIIYSIVAINSDTPWPGYAAAVPVAGTCLILLAAPQSQWLANPASQAIGKWSYSIYLWHWPLYVASRYFEWGQGSWGGAFYLLPASVALGYLSYRFVEEPCRHSSSATAFAGRKVALMAFPVILLGGVGIATKGLPARLPEAVVSIETDPAYIRGNHHALCAQTRGADDVKVCLVGNVSKPPTVAFFGDSHAGAMMHALKQVTEASNTAVLAHPGAGCPPIEGIRGIVGGLSGDECKNYMFSVNKILSEVDSIKTVILIARWSAYLEGYVEKSGGPYAYFDESGVPEIVARRLEYRKRLVGTLCNMAAQHVVYVVLPIPEYKKNVPRELARQLITGIGNGNQIVPLVDYLQRHATVMQAFNEASQKCGIRLIDPVPYLCLENVCNSVIQGRPVYYDDDHLNEFGSSQIVPMLRNVEEFAGLN